MEKFQILCLITFNQEAMCARECAKIPPPPGGIRLKCRSVPFNVSNCRTDKDISITYKIGMKQFQEKENRPWWIGVKNQLNFSRPVGKLLSQISQMIEARILLLNDYEQTDASKSIKLWINDNKLACWFNCNTVLVPWSIVSSGRDDKTKSKTESLSIPSR